MFAYYYRKPPLMGQSLSDESIKILSYAPFFMIFFGFWQLGKRRIFFNEVHEIEDASESINP